MRAARRGSRDGSTLLELLVTMIVVGALAGIVAPNLRSAIFRAEAAKIVTDMNRVRVAVFELREESGGLPRRARWGFGPPRSRSLPRKRVVQVQGPGVPSDYEHAERQGGLLCAVSSELTHRQPPYSASGRAGRDSGSVTWSRRRTRFRLLEDNR